ncbi:hypothetical protein HYW83_06340 [Candidatus Peregrinibacteria bacterium]|nr:hypothetical protein [Candidatus Peregrinibacteria bacterium]
MSTLRNNISAQRIALLAKKQEMIFHIDDLANLWRITDRNTLRVTLKRYTDNKLLYRIYRGFYSLSPVSELDPVLLGAKALHQFCYLSTETILWRNGFISQTPSVYTFISTLSKQFRIGPHRYKSRKLHDRYLYQPTQLIMQNGVKQATAERAIADMLYFNPRFHFDHPVPWKKIKKIQKEIGYSITAKSL